MIPGQVSALGAAALAVTSSAASVTTVRPSCDASHDRTTYFVPKWDTSSPTSGISCAYQYSVPEGSLTTSACGLAIELDLTPLTRCQVSSMLTRTEAEWKTKHSSLESRGMNDERREIGSRIAAARREAGMTQRELADRLGVTTRSVQNYESGSIIPYKHLRRIEVLAHRRVGWILSGDGRDESASETLRQLEKTLERHYALLQTHLDTLHHQTDLLREQRDASARARDAGRRRREG